MTPSRAAFLAFTLASTPAVVLAQGELSPVDSAFERIKVKIVQAQRTAPADRAPIYEELFRLCGAFLETHLRAASAEQIEKAGGFWLMLAERLNAPPQAIQQKLAALRTLPSLPPKLEQVVTRMEAKQALAPGAAAPNVTAADIRDGSQFTLEGLRGKLVLLSFWGVTSDPAKNLAQGKIAPLHQRYAKDPRLVIVGIGVNWPNDTADGQKQFADANHHGWKLVYDVGNAARDAYGVDGIPYLVLVDEEGKILAIGRAIAEVERVLTEKLGAGEAPAAPGGG
jgi:peroxiredoxin